MEPSISAEDIGELIRTRAYRLWEEQGRPDGQEQQHWLAAEKEVLEEVDRSGATGPATHAQAHEPRQAGGAGERQDDLLDEALEETFPGSDPISPKQIA